MKQVILILVLLLVLVPGAGAQKGEPDIGKYVNQINEGQVQQVREQLPALLSKYPNHPGALYVQALLTREGAEAVRIYQSIVDNFPQSEWADDAVYKTYQFYYSLGLYRTAELKMNQLKAQYPVLAVSPGTRRALRAAAERQRTAREHGAAAADTAGTEPGGGETRRSAGTDSGAVFAAGRRIHGAGERRSTEKPF